MSVLFYLVLVHGDFRLDNLIFDPRKVCTVIAFLSQQYSTPRVSLHSFIFIEVHGVSFG